MDRPFGPSELKETSKKLLPNYEVLVRQLISADDKTEKHVDVQIYR